MRRVHLILLSLLVAGGFEFCSVARAEAHPLIARFKEAAQESIIIEVSAPDHIYIGDTLQGKITFLNNSDNNLRLDSISIKNSPDNKSPVDIQVGVVSTPMDLQPTEMVEIPISIVAKAVGYFYMEVTTFNNGEPTQFEYQGFVSKSLTATIRGNSKPIVAGDTVIYSILLINSGPHDLIVDSISAQVMPNSLSMIAIRLIGDHHAVTVPSKDTVRIPMEFIAKEAGDFQMFVTAHHPSDSADFLYQGSIAPTFPVWQRFAGLYLKGCDRDTSLEVFISNYSHEPALIDSIVSAVNGWDVEPAVTDRLVAAESSILVRLTRKKHTAGNGSFVLYVHGAKPQTREVILVLEVFEPQLMPESDTVFVDASTNETKVVVLTAKNSGHGSYFLRPAESTISQAWEIEAIDTTQPVLVSSPAQIFLHLKPQAVEGDYPIIITLRTSACDTVMTKTVVARVRQPSGIAKAMDHQFRVWPQPAIDHLEFESSYSLHYELINLIGAIASEGDASAGRTRIELTDLVPGTYIFRTTAGDMVSSKMISISR